MSYRLACEASYMIAAIAPVAGTLNYEPCQPSQPVSVIHFHGTNVTHLPYDGGVGSESRVGVEFASVQESIEFWTAFNGLLYRLFNLSHWAAPERIWLGVMHLLLLVMPITALWLARKLLERTD